MCPNFDVSAIHRVAQICASLLRRLRLIAALVGGLSAYGSPRHGGTRRAVQAIGKAGLAPRQSAVLASTQRWWLLLRCHVEFWTVMGALDKLIYTGA